MKRARLLELREIYRRECFDSVIPFWLEHSLDRVHGGQFNSLARDGGVFDTDKSMWLQGRALWMFAKLYNEVEPREDWLGAARHIYDFLMRYGFDADGRMFFAVTADGEPLRKRRYIFTETFAVIGLAEYARATGDEESQAARHRYLSACRGASAGSGQARAQGLSPDAASQSA